MTAPGTLAPTVSVWINGVRAADGSGAEPDTDPVVLTDLKVLWGRNNTLDQPRPSSCDLQILDMAGGQRFLDLIGIGDRVDVKTDGEVFGSPTIEMLPDPGFDTGIGPAYVFNGVLSWAAGVLKVAPIDSTKPVRVMFPPAALSNDPSAWNSVPRSKPSQSWEGGASIELHTDLGVAVQRAEIYPVAYTNPNGQGYELLGSLGTVTTPDSWVSVSESFQPPEGVWVGLCVYLWPVGPVWDDLSSNVTTRANLVNNPRAAAVPSQGWQTRSNGTGGVATLSFPTVPDGPPGSGLATCARKVWTTGTTGPTPGADTGLMVYTRAGTGTANLFPILPSTVYTLSCWYRHTSARPKAALLAAYQYDSAGTNLNNPVTSPALPPNVWNRVTLTFTSAATATMVRPTPTINQGVNNQEWAAGEQLEVTGLLLEQAPGPVGTYFDGSTPGASWDGTPDQSTSTLTTSDAITWDAVGAITWAQLGNIGVDDLVLLAPSAGVVKSGLVFSGRVTDLKASYDLGAGGTVVDVICTDHTAELNNRFVGDAPWTAETLNSRFSKVVAASKQSILWSVDAGVQALPITYRDVDSQSALRLLQELGVSAGGVLWSATNLVTGPFLRLEDIGARQALYQLFKDTDGLVRIRVHTEGTGGAVEISACSVLLEPVAWLQTTEDDSTRVAVSWYEQTLDNDNQPAPTQRTETVVNAGAEVDFGQRRLSVSSQLSTQAAALNLANLTLSRVTAHGWRIEGLRWACGPYDPLTSDELDVMLRILDATTRLGLPILLTDLPAWSPLSNGTTVALYLEGARFTSKDGYWILDLITSDAAAQGAASVPWQSLPADWLWNQFAPEVTWADLSGVDI